MENILRGKEKEKEIESKNRELLRLIYEEELGQNK